MRRQSTGRRGRGWSGRVDEPVAQAALRSDVARRVGVVAELVAQAADVDPDVVDFVDVLTAPDLCQQGPVLQDMAGVPDEVVEELVLGRGEVHPLPTKSGLLLGEVDLQLARPEG